MVAVVDDSSLTGDQFVQSFHRNHSSMMTMEPLRDSDGVKWTGQLGLYALPSLEMTEFYRMDDR